MNIKRKRGAVKKEDSILLSAWVPEGLRLLIDQAVVIDDSDVSKFTRKAVKEKLTRMGLMTEGAQ